MSTAILYRTTAGHGVGSGSSLKGMLERAFGGLPCTLSSADIGTLRGMLAVLPNERCFSELIDAVERFDSIEVYAED